MGAAPPEVARYCIGGRIIGALLAAVPGLVDLSSISAGNVRKVALTDMTVNLIVVGLFGLASGGARGIHSEDGRRRFLASGSYSWGLAAGWVESLFSCTAWA